MNIASQIKKVLAVGDKIYFITKEKRIKRIPVTKIDNYGVYSGKAFLPYETHRKLWYLTELSARMAVVPPKHDHPELLNADRRD